MQVQPIPIHSSPSQGGEGWDLGTLCLLAHDLLALSSLHSGSSVGSEEKMLRVKLGLRPSRIDIKVSLAFAPDLAHCWFDLPPLTSILSCFGGSLLPMKSVLSGCVSVWEDL